MPLEEEQIREIVREIMRDEMRMLSMTGKTVFEKHIQILDARHIQLGRTTGTKIGTEGGATGQKIGFYGTTPVVQPALIGDASGDDAAVVNAIIDLLQSLGFMRTS